MTKISESNGLKRMFGEISDASDCEGELRSSSGSNKVRRIENSAHYVLSGPKKSTRLVFCNCYDAIVSFLSVRELCEFSQVNLWAYDKLSARMKELGRDERIEKIWGAIEYFGRFTAGSCDLARISLTYSELPMSDTHFIGLADYKIVKLQAEKAGKLDLIHKELIDWVSVAAPYRCVSDGWQQDPANKLSFNATLVLNFLGIDSDIANTEGKSPILNSLSKPIAKLKFLLSCEKKPSLFFTDRFGKKANLLAVLGNLPMDPCETIEKMQLLLDAGVQLDTENTELSPLHMLFVLKKLEVVKFLIQNGANPNARGRSGMTPLHAAALVGSLDVLKLLYGHSLEKNIQDEFGNTPLHYLFSEGLESTSCDGSEKLKFLLSKGEDPNIKNRSGESSLMKAVQHSSNGLVAELIEACRKKELEIVA